MANDDVRQRHLRGNKSDQNPSQKVVTSEVAPRRNLGTSLQPRGSRLVLLISGCLLGGACLGTLVFVTPLPSHGPDNHHANDTSVTQAATVDNVTIRLPNDAAAKSNATGCRKQPVAWVLTEEGTNTWSIIGSVMDVLEQVGYRLETSWNYTGDFNFMYTHYSIFDKTGEVRDRLTDNHVVNHLPGIAIIALKSSFVKVCHKFDFVPKSFSLPSDAGQFLQYAEQHPHKRWIQKSIQHRQVYLKAVKDIDLEGQRSIVQEFLEDLVLIDGRRFDIGIFATITSIEPLRVYIIDDWVIRFCPDEYEDSKLVSNRRSYVIDDQHRTYTSMPSFNKTVHHWNRRQGVLYHLRSRGYDVKFLEDKFAAAISKVIREGSGYIQRMTHRNGLSGKNLYELLRFDFMIDNDMNVHMLETNMSPDIAPSDDRLVYDSYLKMLHDMLALVGVTSASGATVAQWPEEMRRLLVTDIDLQVDHKRCAVTCQGDNCHEKRCRRCVDCVSPEDVAMLKRTYIEHTNRGRWRRIVPTPFKSQASALRWNPDNDAIFLEMDSGDRLLATWFRGKCLLHAGWCT